MFKTSTFKDKRVLITGHTGFKGSWLSIWLHLLGAEVHGLSCGIPHTPSLFAEAGLDKTFTSDNRADIASFVDVLPIVEAISPDYVFHLAAQPIVKTSYEDPSRTFLTNVIGTVNIFQSLRSINSDSICVFVTSDKCYENKEWVYGYRENDELGGKDPYSSSKACAEIALKSLGRSIEGRRFRYATGRAGNVIGGGDWSDSRIIPDCIRSWERNNCVSIRSPKSTRPWQHVLEPLAGYLRLAECLGSQQDIDGQSFNFGPSDTSYNLNVETVVSILRSECTGLNFVVDESNKIGEEASLLQLDISKSRALLGWSPMLDVESAVRWTGSWYALRKSGYRPLELCLKDINTYMEMNQ